MQKLLMEQSDKMWDRAQKIMHFMLHRGSKTLDMSPAFRLADIQPFDTNGEVKALAKTLSTLKSNAQDIQDVHKHANNKKEHSDSSNDSYDPMVMHFLEEQLLQDYYTDIRHISGQLNVLGRIAKHDNTRAMGLHLFDKEL